MPISKARVFSPGPDLAFYHRYCTFCPPRFSNFFCLLLVPPPFAGSPTPCDPAMPCLIPLKVVHASQMEYNGTMIHIYHALFPKTLATPVHPHDQYNTSHIYSVNPWASRSSPAFLSSPFCVTVGRPIFSSQNSITKAGADSKK